MGKEFLVLTPKHLMTFLKLKAGIWNMREDHQRKRRTMKKRKISTTNSITAINNKHISALMLKETQSQMCTSIVLRWRLSKQIRMDSLTKDGKRNQNPIRRAIARDFLRSLIWRLECNQTLPIPIMI
jgi:hypothetical protein